MKWYQLDKKDIINYLLLSMLSLLYILPIVLINLYFKDDLGWSLRGSIGLKGDGRPLGEYLVLTLCGGEPVTDTAPLPLVLAVLFLSYTLILYARTNLDFISNRYAFRQSLCIGMSLLSIRFHGYVRCPRYPVSHLFHTGYRFKNKNICLFLSFEYGSDVSISGCHRNVSHSVHNQHFFHAISGKKGGLSP